MTNEAGEADALKYILLVDDDDDVRDSMADLRRDEGYRVAGAENGLVALGQLNAADLPCVIVLDLMMPMMDGPEFRARQLETPGFAGVPVIVMSAAFDGAKVASELGARRFLSKPVSPSELLKAVAQAC